MAIDFNALMDKAKDLAQTGVAKAKELADTAVDKGKEVSEIGKLKVQNASEQEAVKRAYLELGKLYYAERGSAPEAAYAALCQQITESNEKIAYNNERIEDIKASGKADEDDFEDVEPAPAEECCQEPAHEEGCCCGCHEDQGE